LILRALHRLRLFSRFYRRRLLRFPAGSSDRGSILDSLNTEEIIEVMNFNFPLRSPRVPG